MNLYYELLKYPVFTVDDLKLYYKNINSARTAIKSLMNQGLVTKIRNNLYTCMSGETGSPVANRFQVAGAVSDTSYVSHHTAMEYFGITDQVFFNVYVASETSFRSFEFDGYTFVYVPSKFSDGVETIEFSGGIRVSNKERTLIDCLKDMDKIGGLEEIISNIQSLRRLNERLVLRYLELYRNQFLYQKAGYLLWQTRTQLGLSDQFFEICKSKIGMSKRYLTSDYKSGKYDDIWKLVVPENISNIKNGGMIDADV